MVGRLYEAVILTLKWASGFTVSLYEYEATIPTLWDAVKEFTQENQDLVEPGNAMSFVSDDNGKTYNRCHCVYLSLQFQRSADSECYALTVWSNFEIADLDFWRSEPYMKFFEFLDKKGGFYYEVRRMTHNSSF